LNEGLELIHKLIDDVAQGEYICGIGVAAGGPLNHKTGVISPLHQPEWNDVPLYKILTDKYDCPIYIDVDTNIAALAEAQCRGGKESGKLLYITLSTGMGGGFVVDGEIYRGHNKSHPEIGHQSINYRCSHPERITCTCGASDCLEGLVSGNGIKRIYQKEPKDLSAEEWGEVAYNLGQGLRNLATIYAPDIFVLGGGIIHHQGEPFVEKAKQVMHDNLHLVPAPKVRISRFGYDTALIGSIIAAVNTASK